MLQCKSFVPLVFLPLQIMGFQSLPSEAINTVLSLVDLPSLKSTRLLSKQFSSHATPLLFENIEIWLQTTSLTR
jgi:hypothetical protein